MSNVEVTRQSEMLVKIEEIEIVKIIPPEEKQSAEEVNSLVESIKDVGLLQPILLKRVDGGDGYGLVAGRRRLAAYILLDRETIPAIVTNLEGLNAELATIDENLWRKDFTAMERGELLARRKAIYEELHPETKRPKGGRRKKNDAIIAPFSADTAKNTGESLRTVQNYLTIGTGITPEAKEIVRGTEAEDRVTDLLKVASANPKDQPKLAKSVVAALKSKRTKTEGASKQKIKRGKRAANNGSNRSAGKPGGSGASDSQGDASPGSSKEERAFQVIIGDCLEKLRTVEEGTARIIFADPPEQLGWKRAQWDIWLKACANLLTRDGSLWLFVGDEVAAQLATRLDQGQFHRRAWLTVFHKKGAERDRNFSDCSRHLFYAVRDLANFVFDAKNARLGRLADDVWEMPHVPAGDTELLQNFVGQLPVDLLAPIIRVASEPGDLVVDTFSGSATTGVAAIEHGRNFVGIEIDSAIAEKSRERLKGTGAKDCSVLEVAGTLQEEKKE
jgi:ParB-like chromosome segregation protein Spo0J